MRILYLQIFLEALKDQPRILCEMKDPMEFPFAYKTAARSDFGVFFGSLAIASKCLVMFCSLGLGL